MGYDYNDSDALNLKEKLSSCQTESNNLCQDSSDVINSIYGKLHENTSKKYSDDYDLRIKPDEWFDTINDIVSNLDKVMEQLALENAVQSGNINGTIGILAGVNMAANMGEASAVLGVQNIYTVNTESGNLNVRDANGNIITSIPKNSSVKLIGGTNENGYVEVEYGDGKTGYVHSDYLKKVNVQVLTGNSYTHIVNTESGNLNVRDISGNIITSIPKNSSVKVIGETNENGYVEVEYGNGQTGYVYQDYLKEATNQGLSGNFYTHTVNTEGGNLNVRDADGNIITTIPKDSAVKVVGATKENGYVEVEYGNGETGYVYQDYLKEATNQAEASYQTESNFEVFEGIVNTQDTGLNVRSSPTSDNSSNIIGSLGKGSNINIIGEEGNWYKISLDNGQEAYVSKQFVTKR